jgi:SAM-dependent methyltransferase
MTEGESREAAETRRIEDEYRYRDVARATSALYSFGDPAHVLYLQELEWELLRVLRDLDVDLSTSRVLDVGCGFGYLTHRLSEYGAHTTVGIDLMQHRINEARTRYPSITFERADHAVHVPVFRSRRAGAAAHRKRTLARLGWHGGHSLLRHGSRERRSTARRRVASDRELAGAGARRASHNRYAARFGS